eukprot:COSAG05_NODE_398_length_10293_cov_11.919176_8_plen_77_part_00
MIKTVGKSESCMVSKLTMIFKRTRSTMFPYIVLCMLEMVAFRLGFSFSCVIISLPIFFKRTRIYYIFNIQVVYSCT